MDRDDSRTDADDATRRYLQQVLLPFWFVPGLLDWRLHKKTRIEETSGTRESLIHGAMMAEIGLPAAAALVLEPNAGLLALMGAAAVTHHATAVKDVRVAYESPRQILPAEQHVHAFLEVLPWQALAMIATLNWDQLRALAGRSPQRADWRLRRKRRPLSRGYIAAVTGSVLIFIGMPYGEELVRCLRSARP